MMKRRATTPTPESASVTLRRPPITEHALLPCAADSRLDMAPKYDKVHGQLDVQ